MELEAGDGSSSLGDSQEPVGDSDAVNVGLSVLIIFVFNGCIVDHAGDIPDFFFF